MSFKLKRMKRTIFLSLLSFVLVLFLMLNLMIVQLHSSKDSKEHPEVFPKDGKISEIIDRNIYEAQIRRKPKTANFDETDNEMNPSYDENVMDEHQLEPNRIEKVKLLSEIKPGDNIYRYSNGDDIHDKHKSNANIPNDANKNKGQNDKVVEEMESIDDQYKEDDNVDDDDFDEDDDEGEDDNDDEYEYDDNDTDGQYDVKNDKEPNGIAQYNNKLKTNPVFKPGDFGDIRGFEYYSKPKLKVEEIHNDVVKVSEAKPRKAKPTEAKPKEKPVLIENGIYWSSYIENQVPKGKNA